jgi:hypothetical protein
MQSFVAPSNSATPTYANGLPTYAGSTSEGVYVGFWTVVQNSHAFVPTDVRGKFFYSDPFAGTIQLAKRGANNAGFKPASGLKIHIPNVILGTSTAADYAAQHLSFVSQRYTMNISGGVFDLDTATWGWFLTNVTPISFVVKNAAWANTFNVLNFSSEIRNSCIAPILYANAGGAVLVQNSANAFIYDSRIVRASGIAFQATASANVNAYRSRFENIRQLQGRTQRNAAFGSNPSAVSIVSSGGEFVDCTVIGGSATINVQNYSVRNLTYCDNMTGTTPAVASRAVAVQGSNILIDGISALAGIDNNHPFAEYVNQNGFTSNLTIHNIGSPTAPLNAGTVNPTGTIALLGSNAGTTFELRRCYVTNLRSSVMALSPAGPVVTAFDVWGDGTTLQTIASSNVITRGGRWTNQRTGLSGNQGSHWDDAYNSTTTGRITIMANEPTGASAAQCNVTLGAGSGFNGSGSMIISRLTDVVNWTTPLKMYGHTAFAGGCAVSGTDCQNLIFEYKIDTGPGFGGSWAFLANTVRRSGGGTSGTNTVTVTTADRTALTRQPQVGDFVQTGSFRLPANTTVTNIAGDVITCSNNFTANLTSSEFVTFSPVNVAVSAADGYALQVRTYPTAAATTTLLTALSMSIQTDATSQQIQHPLPGSLVNITNLIPQTRVKVTRADTGGLLQQASCGDGTTLNFDFQYTGSVKIEARNASSIPAYKPWITQVSISPTATINVVALQESDQ